MPLASKRGDAADGSDSLDANVAVGLAMATTTRDDGDDDDGAADIED